MPQCHDAYEMSYQNAPACPVCGAQCHDPVDGIDGADQDAVGESDGAAKANAASFTPAT